jgi:hypothetical protein
MSNKIHTSSTAKDVLSRIVFGDKLFQDEIDTTIRRNANLGVTLHFFDPHSLAGPKIGCIITSN